MRLLQAIFLALVIAVYSLIIMLVLHNSVKGLLLKPLRAGRGKKASGPRRQH